MGFLLTAAFVGILCLLYILFCLIFDFEIWYPSKKHNEYKIGMNAYIDIVEKHPMIGYNRTRINYDDLPHFTFEQFKKFYSLNPDSWILLKYRVYKNNSHKNSCVFDYKEWKKYDRFRMQLEKDKEKKKELEEQAKTERVKNERTIELLKLVQQDIDTVRGVIQHDFNEAADLIDRIAKG